MGYDLHSDETCFRAFLLQVISKLTRQNSQSAKEQGYYLLFLYEHGNTKLEIGICSHMTANKILITTHTCLLAPHSLSQLPKSKSNTQEQIIENF